MLIESDNLIPRPAVARMFGVVCVTVKRWEKVYGLTVHKINSRVTAYPATEIERIKDVSRVTGAASNSQPPQFSAAKSSRRKVHVAS